MDQISEMLRTSPGATLTGSSALPECIRACLDCGQVCIACADACLGEEQVAMLKRCIRLNLDCADLCSVSTRLLMRQREPAHALLIAQLEATALACRLCAQECERHQERHAHCRVCARACRRCEEACASLLNSLREEAPAGATRTH